MKLESYISHYFEKEVGPLLNICDLKPQQRKAIIEREKNAQTGFNRFAEGEEFFEFRQLADDLIIEAYTSKFGHEPKRRPYYAVLGDADVVGGLYRDPYKIQIPVGELTFMVPDHFHLVSFMKRGEQRKMFGCQLPENYSEAQYPYFGKLMTYQELMEGYKTLKIDQFLENGRTNNNWYRYVEAQVWGDPEKLRAQYSKSVEVTPETWTFGGMTYLQNYKNRRALKK